MSRQEGAWGETRKRRPMTRETKVGLLVGMGLILLIGVIVSDHWAVVQQQAPAELTRLAEQAQRSIHHVEHLPEPVAERGGQVRRPAAPVPTPDELEAARQAVRPAMNLGNQNGGAAAGSMAGPVAGMLTLDDELTPVPEPADEPEPARHRVARGESLYRIAERYYGEGDAWRRIAEANPERVDEDGRVRAGDELVIPLLQMPGFEPAGRERAVRITELPHERRGAQREIKVQPGQTLSDLAARYLGSAGRWRELLEANRDRLDSPERLRAGMALRLPAGASPAGAGPAPPGTYTVQSGDNLTRIAARLLGDGDRWREIYEANRDQLSSPDAVRQGQTLRLP